MQNMSDYLAKLEGFPDLEASIIRATKINKVLKAMLKISDIPKETEHNFKPRSQTLLDKWNKILAAEASAAGSATPANGVNGASEDAAAPKETKESTNGVNGDAEAAKETAKKEEAESKEETVEPTKTEEKFASTPSSEKPAEEVSIA